MKGKDFVNWLWNARDWFSSYLVAKSASSSEAFVFQTREFGDTFSPASPTSGTKAESKCKIVSYPYLPSSNSCLDIAYIILLLYKRSQRMVHSLHGVACVQPAWLTFFCLFVCLFVLQYGWPSPPKIQGCQIDQQIQRWCKDQLQDSIANKGMAWPNYRQSSFPSWNRTP